MSFNLTQGRVRWLAFLPLLAVLAVALVATAIPTRAAAFSCATVTDVVLSECNALSAVYNNMGGTAWSNKTGWLTDDDTTVCDWYGVVCGVANHVTELNLAFNNLSGSVPSSIGDLSSLQILSLDGIVGPVPTELQTLWDLQVLSLEGEYENTQFSGPLPDLGGLSNLTSLYIGYSNINGPIPVWINEFTFPNLTSLRLNKNRFTDVIPFTLTDMVGLQTLQLQGNGIHGVFTGNFPDFSATCSTLTSLDLSGNNFTPASMPSWITSCTNLTNLNLYYTRLTGAFPDLSALTNLTDINLSQNLFTAGAVPSWLINMAAPRSISISNTFRTGSIPEFAHTASIETLQLDNNRFTGGIPASYNLTNYPNLGNINFFANNLTSIHPNYASFATSPLNTFTTVYLNALVPSTLDPAIQANLDSVNSGWRTFQVVPPTTFTITPQTGGMSVIVNVTPVIIDYIATVDYRVEMSTTPGGPYTQVGTGSAAGSSTNPFNVTVNGLIPGTTYYFVTYSSVNVGYGIAPVLNTYVRNSVASVEQSATTLINVGPTNCADTVTNGGIPETECNSLVSFYNDNSGASWVTDTNWLMGSPCSWYGITCADSHVTQINLEGNNINGVMPDLSSLTKLTTLHLGSNSLTGSFPLWIAEHPLLSVVNLRGNHLSDTIPSLSLMNSLTELHLEGNEFSGSFPSGLASKTTVQRIFLDDNTFTGTIPSLSGMTGLIELSVYNNGFSGALPTLPSAQFAFFGASGNQFSGDIPVSYGSLTNLTGLVLDGNALTGDIPAGIGTLSNLGVGATLSDVGFSYNALTATDANVIALLALKDTDFADTQTVAPTSPSASSPANNSVSLLWTPISYTSDSGYYEVGYRVGTTGSYTFSAVNRTADKNAVTLTVNNLAGNTNYCLVIRTITLPHSNVAEPSTNNNNSLTSGNSAEVCAVTTGGGTPTNPPTPPVLSEPTNGSIFTGLQSPTLYWEQNLPVEQVTSYRLTIKNQASGLTVFNKSYAASAVCDGGLCSVDLSALNPVVVLANARHEWQVTASNADGNTKSAKFLFTLTKPSKPVLLSPIGNTTLNTAFPTMTFEITEGENLTSLKLSITKLNAPSPVYNQALDIETVCESGLCEVVITPALGNGSYTWKVQARNANGSNTSAAGSFKIAFPEKATGLAPSSNTVIDTLKPSLSWDDVTDATEYRVTVVHSTGTKVVLGWTASGAPGFDCEFGVCTLDMTLFTGAPNLKKGSLVWFVEARNTSIIAASKSKSAVAAFKIVLPARNAVASDTLPLPPDGFRAP